MQPNFAVRGCNRNGGKQRHIFFERDMAGFNNIKLQLQSMVAIAAITGRTLVLPPPGHADHMKEEPGYYEFEFFDAGALMKVVNISLTGVPDENTLKVEDDLHSVDIHKLDQDRDWFFSMAES